MRNPVPPISSYIYFKFGFAVSMAGKLVCVDGTNIKQCYDINYHPRKCCFSYLLILDKIPTLQTTNKPFGDDFSSEK